MPFSSARIVITGAQGQLGSELCQALGARAIGVDLPELNLTDADAVRTFLREEKPAAVINTAAYTQVDLAEEAVELCEAINHRAVATLAEATAELDCLLVQISTDYVFFGNRESAPFHEDAPITPHGVYAESKARGEAAARINPKHLVVRSCGLYGSTATPDAKNFVNTICQLAKSRDELSIVDDQVCCPTWVHELSQALLFLVENEHVGTFHVVNHEPLTWFQFARHLVSEINADCRLVPITTADFGARAPRPAFSALDTSKYDALGGPPLSTCVDAASAFLARFPRA